MRIKPVKQGDKLKLYLCAMNPLFSVKCLVGNNLVEKPDCVHPTSLT